jgi:hypothetical protein
MSITGHADPAVFKRYNVRRDAVQGETAERLSAAYRAARRGTTRPCRRWGCGSTSTVA